MASFTLPQETAELEARPLLHKPTTGTQVWNRTILFAHFTIADGISFWQEPTKTPKFATGCRLLLGCRNWMELWNFLAEPVAATLW
jgi:hypothetical protein